MAPPLLNLEAIEASIGSAPLLAGAGFSVSAGERVVTSNLYRLEPGTTVRINGAAARKPT